MIFRSTKGRDREAGCRVAIVGFFSVCLTDLASFGVIPGRPLGIADLPARGVHDAQHSLAERRTGNGRSQTTRRKDACASCLACRYATGLSV